MTKEKLLQILKEWTASGVATGELDGVVRRGTQAQRALGP